MNISKYYRAGIIEIHSLRAFIVNFYTSLLYYPAELIILYFIWKLIFSAIGTETIGGFTFSMLISYFILQRILARFLSSGKLVRELDNLINRGNLVTYLTRPVNFVAFKFSQTVTMSLIQTALGCISFVVVAGLLNLTISYQGVNWLMFIPLIFMALLIIFMLDFLLGILAFWLGRVEHIRIVYSLLLRIVSGALVPISFFPQEIQSILGMLPFQYMFYVPISIVVGAAELSLSTFMVPVFWIIILAALLKIGWSRGLNRFEVQGG